MNYDEWNQQVPLAITGDSLWRMEAYKLALFASDMSWFDTTKLESDRRTRELSDQLYRSVGSIGANLAEGYSRGTGKDRARFYEYALGICSWLSQREQGLVLQRPLCPGRSSCPTPNGFHGTDYSIASYNGAATAGTYVA